ncbi:MAG: type II toxin-antitoxin system RelE/ParE family toxin [Bythopirellula sp.]|nr:type II toxin-antitoxin system RelE/ParE family toxin [Bythopirellula sp.]
MSEIEVVEYENDSGKNVFALWLASLDIKAFAKVNAAVARMRHGNFGDVKPVGEGVSERRIDFGPGYCIYFGRDGQKLVILLGGGTKSRQDRDISDAQAAWQEYKQSKKRKPNHGTD